MSSFMNNLANNRLAMGTLNFFAELAKKRIPYVDDNPFLKGPFAPVAESIHHDFNVIGTIPKQLDGLFLRMGPNPLEVKNPTLYNWFIGDGMVHGLRLKDGQALWCKSRYVGTHQVHDKLKRPRIEGNPRGVADITNTNIIGHAGKIWTIVEAGPLPVEMDAELNSVRYRLFNDDEKFAFSAHPHKDHETGELHAICYDALVMNQIHYHVIDQDGKLKNRVSIPVQHGPMMHDCNMTASKMVIFDLPITFSISNIMRGADFPYQWNEKHQARIGLLPKNGDAKDIRWFKVDPCFIFHSCNAYDLENGDVILDAAVHDETFKNTIQGPSDGQVVRFERWHLQYATGEIKRTVISATPQEFPRFDERLAGKPYRYAYTITLGEEGTSGNPTDIQANYLLKHDLESNETTQHFYGEGYVTGEVIFIPNPDTHGEDEGWLISYVHSIECKNSKVVILDAKDITQEPVAIIELPTHIPLGFHSNWVNQADLDVK